MAAHPGCHTPAAQHSARRREKRHSLDADKENKREARPRCSGGQHAIPRSCADVTGPARSGVVSRVVRARARVPCYTTVRRFGGLPAPARATGRPMRLETRHEATDTWWDAGIESWLSDHRCTPITDLIFLGRTRPGRRRDEARRCIVIRYPIGADRPR